MIMGVRVAGYLAEIKRITSRLLGQAERRWRQLCAAGLGLQPRLPALKPRVTAVTLLLSFATAIGAAAYILFDRGTALPSVNPVPGSVTFFTATQGASATIDVSFVRLEPPSEQDERPIMTTSESPTIGGSVVGPYDQYDGMVLAIAGRVRAGQQYVRWSILAEPAVRLSEVRSFHGSVSIMEKDTFVRFPGGFEKCPCQVISGQADADAHGAFSIDLQGRMAARIAQTAAGVTYAQLPRIQPNEWTDRETVTFDKGLGPVGRWYPPTTTNVTADLGPVQGPDVVSFVYPPDGLKLDENWGLELRWSGKYLPYVRAEVVNRSQQRRANGLVFVAGALAGLSGALLVEAMLRVSAFRKLEVSTKTVI